MSDFTALTLAATSYSLAVAADCWTTHVALRRGLREGNPVMAKLFGRHVVLASAVLSVAYLVFAVWAAKVAMHPALPTAIWSLAALAAWRGFCAFRNLMTLRREIR
jgi:hypothetical protein